MTFTSSQKLGGLPIMLLVMFGTGFLIVVMVQGSGRLSDPPQRSSLWRYPADYPGAEPNYDDGSLSCGGFAAQYNSINQGRCGECGDEWSIPRPRPNDEGGKYGKNIIAKNYTSGSEVEFKVDITASHGGHYEFRLCSKGSADELIEQDCLDQILLYKTDGTTGVNVDQGSVVYSANYKLPDGLTCDFCVLQWTWISGNNWGDCGNGTQGSGCGNQETHKNCADIAIL